jgi:hypothetical protein
MTLITVLWPYNDIPEKRRLPMTKEVEYNIGKTSGQFVQPHHPNASAVELELLAKQTAAGMRLDSSKDFLRGWYDGYREAARGSRATGNGAAPRKQGKKKTTKKTDREA